MSSLPPELERLLAAMVGDRWIEAGPFDDMLVACKCAALATRDHDSPGAVVAMIREAIEVKRDRPAGLL